MKNKTVKSIALALHTEGSHNHRTEITGPIHEIPTYSELRARGNLLAEAVRKALKLEQSLGMASNPISIKFYKDALAVWEAAQ